MQREIKFRGLRTDGKGWVYGSFIHNSIDCPCIVDYDADQYEIIPKSVGQYTGLKGKNGTDIYEGDVLHSNMYHKTWIAEFTPCDGLKLAIKYDDDFKIEGIFQTHEDWSYNKVSSCEIIGNIHEQKSK